MTPLLEKSRARVQAKRVREQAHCPGAAFSLMEHFPAQIFRGRVLGSFWPIQSEIDVRPLMTAWHDMGEALALPCTPRAGKPLTFRAWQPDDPLRRGPHETREPSSTQPQIHPDIVLVPLLAFTNRGERLGYGGGFYDRTLAALRKDKAVWACGVAYSAQEADTLPTEAHDARLDAVLTDRIYKEF